MNSQGGFLISQIKQLQDRLFERLLAAHGLSASGGRGRVFYVLWETPALSLRELSRRTSLAENTASAIVSGMVAAGLVERRVDPASRRRAILSLTARARAQKETFDAVSRQMTELFYQGIPPEEAAQFEATLARVLENLTAAEECVKKGGAISENA